MGRASERALGRKKNGAHELYAEENWPAGYEGNIAH